MNPPIEQLASIPYVRRVISAEGAIGALTDDTVGLNEKPAALVELARKGLVSFHAPMSVVGAADCSILWDRVADDLRRRLDGVAGVIDVKHRWCTEEERVEVEVGRKTGDDHAFSMRDTEEKPLYAEGVYAIVSAPVAEDRKAAVALYEESLVSAYRTDLKRDYVNAEKRIVARARKAFFTEQPKNAQHAAEQERGYKERVQEELQEELEAAEAADTPEALRAYVAKARAEDTAEDREAYYVGAMKSVCAERISKILEGIPAGLPWGVEMIEPEDVDERYGDLP